MIPSRDYVTAWVQFDHPPDSGKEEQRKGGGGEKRNCERKYKNQDNSLTSEVAERDVSGLMIVVSFLSESLLLSSEPQDSVISTVYTYMWDRTHTI